MLAIPRRLYVSRALGGQGRYLRCYRRDDPAKPPPRLSASRPPGAVVRPGAPPQDGTVHQAAPDLSVVRAGPIATHLSHARAGRECLSQVVGVDRHLTGLRRLV